MKKITKKEFKALHVSGKLSLVTLGCRLPLVELIDIIAKNPMYTDDFFKSKTKPVSNVDLSNSGKYCITECYKLHSTFYAIETTVDNSLNSGCSWDTIEKSTILYMVK